MEKYITKQQDLLQKESATQLDIAKLISSLQKLQLKQDYFAAGIIECDDNLNELLSQIKSMERLINNIEQEFKIIPDILKEVEYIQQNTIGQWSNIEDLKNKTSTLEEILVRETELLRNQSDKLNSKISNIDNNLGSQIQNINRAFYKNKKIIDARFTSSENIIRIISKKHKKEIFHIKLYFGILFLIIFIVLIYHLWKYDYDFNYFIFQFFNI
jgi:hypothetical protein